MMLYDDVFLEYLYLTIKSLLGVTAPHCDLLG